MTRILFVDDDPFMLAAMRRVLRRSQKDWDAHFADNGMAALEMLDELQPDVIVSDMRMPGMTGLELLTQVRDQFPAVRRIVLSGQTDVEPQEHSDIAHAWLPKPCEPGVLRKTVDDLLASRTGPDHKSGRTLS